MLKGKKIIVGITGSIAAYKAAYLVRFLIKKGAEVQVLMTRSGKEFITPVTLSALSGRPVLGQFFETKDGTWNSHVDLGLWADLMLVAPASANTMGKMVNGICDNLLLTTYLSARCPVFVAPAMDLDMYNHPTTQQNIDKLISFGNYIIEPGSGELASGLYGKGRMEEPEVIVEKLEAFFADQLDQSRGPLYGKKFLVTAGPTFEKIDPVRFIGNYSSGKMGYAIAHVLANKGATVELISGPVSTQLSAIHPRIIKHDVESASEMYSLSKELFVSCDGAVLAAAVADYAMSKVADQKIKRLSDELVLKLEPTKDIAKELGKLKRENQLLVGFALETTNAIENAKGKLIKKNLNMIVLNSLEDEGAGFGVDTNKITIIDAENNISEFPLKDKEVVAVDIVDQIISKI